MLMRSDFEYQITILNYLYYLSKFKCKYKRKYVNANCMERVNEQYGTCTFAYIGNNCEINTKKPFLLFIFENGCNIN